MTKKSHEWKFFFIFAIFLLPGLICEVGCQASVAVHRTPADVEATNAPTMEPYYTDSTPSEQPVENQSDYVEPSQTPVNPVPTQEEAGQYKIYFAYFNDKGKLNTVYEAVKALEQDGVLTILTVSHPDDKSKILYVNCNRGIGALSDELKGMCTRYGLLRLSYQVQPKEIMVTDE